MKLHKVTVFCLSLLLAGTASTFALEFKGTAPQFTGIGEGPLLGPASQVLAGSMNDQVNGAFREVLNNLNTGDFGRIDPKPEQLLRAFGDAAVFGSHGATQRAYGGYKLLSVTAGPMIGIRLPSSPFTIVDEIEALTDNLMNEGDIQVGLSPQLLNFQVGVNTSKFLLKNLYLGLRFGVMNLEDPFGLEGFTFNYFTLGLTANYQILQPVTLAKLVVWRGVSLGSGIIYQGTKVGFNMEMDTITENIGFTPLPSPLSGSVNPILNIDPKLELDINVNTVTIPVEAVTALKLLGALNLSFGVGADLGFGTSELKAGLSAPIYFTNLEPVDPYVTHDEGNVTVDAGGTMAPSVFNVKLMTGIGFSAGPVLLDIPVTFYLGNGYSIGVTLGVAL